MSGSVPWTASTKICLLSRSKVKFDAVKSWLDSCDSANELVPMQPADPNYTCPQPVGARSAIQCLAKRLELQECTEDVVLVAVENFLVPQADGSWKDYAHVAVRYMMPDRTVVTEMACGKIGNTVPAAFAPHGEPDIETPKGYSVTCGERIHDALPYIPHDDWAHYVDADNICREIQIMDALDQLTFQRE